MNPLKSQIVVPLTSHVNLYLIINIDLPTDGCQQIICKYEKRCEGTDDIFEDTPEASYPERNWRRKVFWSLRWAWWLIFRSLQWKWPWWLVGWTKLFNNGCGWVGGLENRGHCIFGVHKNGTHENKIWRHKTGKRCLGGFWDTEVAVAAYWASGRTQIRFAWRTQLVGWSRTSKESFGKISMGDGRMFFKPFSVYHIMRSSPPSNVFVILTPGLLLPKHAYTGQSPPSNVTESTFHLQCVSWGKLWGEE